MLPQQRSLPEPEGQDATRVWRRRLDQSTLYALCDGPDFWTDPGWRRALEQYEAELGGERLEGVAVEDAAAWVSRITWRWMLERRYAEAERELLRFLRHPETEQVENVWELWCRLAFCALARGAEAEALADFRRIMAGLDASQARLAACFIRNNLAGGPQRLRGIGPGWPRKGLASQAMTRFVIELSSFLRHQRPPRRLPRRTSYRKLRRSLMKTFPPYRYADVDVTGCDPAEAARRLCEEALRQIRMEMAESTLEGARVADEA